MRTSFFITAFALTPLAAASPLRLPSPAAGAIEPRQDGSETIPLGLPDPFDPNSSDAAPSLPDARGPIPPTPNDPATSPLSNAPKTPLSKNPDPPSLTSALPRDPAAQSPDTGSTAPPCDTSKLQLPASALTAPSGQLLLVALGKGTQNYTCNDTLSAPTSIGALAQLFDATCALASNASSTTSTLQLTSAPIGTHFFLDTTTPDFDVSPLGNTVLKKAQETDAPDPATDVKWLRLTAQAAGTTSRVAEVYRVGTVGGKAPATCAGKTPGEVFTVAYEAQYWFFG